MSLSIEEQLRQSRLNLQMEVRMALSCRTKKQKIALVAKWKEKYSPIYVQELLNVARNKKTAVDILDWDLGNFRGNK
jgi:hypothetical protein